MPSLFPADGEKVTIKQGKVGDCYLLASLDCMLNGNQENRNLVKQMFTETSDGGVIVQVKRTEQSRNLKLLKLAGKYTHSTAPNGDDLFTISKERLDEIKNSSDGAKSNSLAVNILERLSSYYYVPDWDPAMLASINAHNITEQRHDTTSTKFVGNLVGIAAKDYSAKEINDIIDLKKIKPSEPVYISMSYGEKDAYGKIHSRHSLRVQDIIVDEAGNYNFVLVNPWDNSKTEKYSAEYIQSRSPRFCIYSQDPQKHDLEMMLAKLPNKEMGKYVIDRPTFLNKLLLVKKSSDGLLPKQLEAHILLHQQAVLTTQYHKLDESADRSFFRKHLALLDEKGIAGFLEQQDEPSLKRLKESYSNFAMKNLIDNKLQEKANKQSAPLSAEQKRPAATVQSTEVKGQVSPLTKKPEPKDAGAQFSDESFPKDVKSRHARIKKWDPERHVEFSRDPLTYYNTEIASKEKKLFESQKSNDNKILEVELKVLRTERTALLNYYQQHSNAAAHVQPTQAPPQATPAVPVQPTQAPPQATPVAPVQPTEVKRQPPPPSPTPSAASQQQGKQSTGPQVPSNTFVNHLLDRKREAQTESFLLSKQERLSLAENAHKNPVYEMKIVSFVNLDEYSYLTPRKHFIDNLLKMKPEEQSEIIKAQANLPEGRVNMEMIQERLRFMKQHGTPNLQQETNILNLDKQIEHIIKEGYRKNQSAALTETNKASTPASSPNDIQQGISKEPELKLPQTPTETRPTPSLAQTVMAPAPDTAPPAPSQTSTAHFKQRFSNVKNQELQKLVDLEEKILNKSFNYHGGGKIDTETGKTYPQGALDVLNIIRTLKNNPNPTKDDLDQACKDILKKLDGKSSSRAYMFERGGRDLDTAVFYQEAVITVKSVEASLNKPVTLGKPEDEPKIKAPGGLSFS
jgi:hypothetical protein